MGTVGTVTGTLRVNLRMKTPVLLGLRARIAGALCHVAAAVLGGNLIVELAPELTTQFGNDAPTTTAL